MEDFMNIPTIDFGLLEDKSQRILKIVGVGGGGRVGGTGECPVRLVSPSE